MMHATLYQTGGTVKIITTPQAIQRCRVGGKPINRKTFFKLAAETKTKPVETLTQGTHLWDLEEIDKMAKRLHKRRGKPGERLF